MIILTAPQLDKVTSWLQCPDHETKNRSMFKLEERIQEEFGPVETIIKTSTRKHLEAGNKKSQVFADDNETFQALIDLAHKLITRTIKHSAVKQNGIIYIGHRHHDCFATMHKCGINRIGSIQGFVDDTGKFLDRTEALKVAKEAGQIIKKYAPDYILCSEDIFPPKTNVEPAPAMGQGESSISYWNNYIKKNLAPGFEIIVTYQFDSEDKNYIKMDLINPDKVVVVTSTTSDFEESIIEICQDSRRYHKLYQKSNPGNNIFQNMKNNILENMKDGDKTLSPGEEQNITAAPKEATDLTGHYLEAKEEYYR